MVLDPALKERVFRKRICQKCTTVNPMTAKHCRKCGSSALRIKKGEKKVK